MRFSCEKFIAPGMEGGDLVVVEVGGDERLRGELARDALELRAAQPERCNRARYGSMSSPTVAMTHRILAQQLQVVGDVAGGAAVLAPHLRREEAYVEDVQLVGEQVVAEAVREHHDGVVGDRAGDEDFHEG